MEWQPIDTAPKDGTHILSWESGMKWPEAIIWIEYDDDIKEELDAVGYWSYSDGVLADIAEAQPTHWMPLPAPPET